MPLPATSGIRLLAALCGLLSGFVTVAAAAVPETPQQAPAGYQLREIQPREESIFDIVFGSPPPLATERGILIIDAFNDLNNNGKQDDGELPLVEEISCRLDNIDYQVPAFIPGLSYNESYQIACDGKTYQPSMNKPDIFIEKRGQVIHLLIPCQPRLQPVPPPIK